MLKKLLSATPLSSNHSHAFSERLIKAKSEIESYDAFKSMDAFSQVLYEIFHLTILPTLLRNYDRYSMSNGLEIRMPFMDWRPVCYKFSLSLQAKIGGSFKKRIQRDSLSGILCDPVRLRREKIGWNAPAHEWFQGPLRPFIEDALGARADSAYANASRNAWKAFNNISRPTFSDGQKRWNAILPHLGLSCLDEPIWN